MDTVAREESGYERVQQAHYRPARLIGLLLILQVAGLVGIIVFEFREIDWLIQQPQQGGLTIVSRQDTGAVMSVFLVPPAVLAFLAALSLLILARRGWLLAAISQGLCLGICLWIYSETAPAYVYPVMVSCIVLIFYLNSRTVRTLFRPGRVRRRSGGRT